MIIGSDRFANFNKPRDIPLHGLCDTMLSAFWVIQE
jgi:hypothetical protein